MTDTTTHLNDSDDEFDDDFGDDEVTENTAPVASKPTRSAPAPTGNNPLTRWMASKGYRTNYPKWAWWGLGLTVALGGCGAIGAFAGDDTTPTLTQPNLSALPAPTSPTTTAPAVDPFIGMPPRHPWLDWVLTGRSVEQVALANQVRTSRDKAGDPADPCRLWVGIVLNNQGQRTFQMVQQDEASLGFPVPVFIGAQCDRPEPNEFGLVPADPVVQSMRSAATTAAPAPAPEPPTTTAAPVTTVLAPVETVPPVVEQPVAPQPFIHVTQPREGLMAIARIYGVTLEDLAAVNGWPTDAQLYIGQHVVIPGRWQS